MTNQTKQIIYPAKAIFFDLDGTLVDTIPLVVESHRHTFATCLGFVPDDDTILATIGAPLMVTFGKYGEEKGKEMLDEYTKFSYSRTAEMSEIFPGVTETLAALQARGFILGIVTSRRRDSTEILLEKYDLRRYLSSTVTAFDTERGKPNPDPLYLAMAQTGMTQDESPHVVFVGDSVHDIGCGNNAGAVSCAVGWSAMKKEDLKAARPTFWIEHMSDLLQRVERYPKP